MNFTKNILTIALTTMLALSAVSCGNTKSKYEVKDNDSSEVTKSANLSNDDSTSSNEVINHNYEFEKFQDMKGLTFKITPMYYPDLVASFDTKRTFTKEEEQVLETIFKKNEHIYISEFGNNSIMFDFQGIDPDDKNGLPFIFESLHEISQLDFADEIVHVIVE